jgi:hypothetical protein
MSCWVKPEQTCLEPPSWIVRSQGFYVALQIVLYPRDGEGTGLTKYGQEPQMGLFVMG